MIGTVLRSNDGKTVVSPPSLFNPPEEVKNLTVQVREDYTVGFELLNRPYPEFNDMNLITRQSIDQKAFGIYQEPAFQNPDERWRWTGVRPLTRNKLISIAAHMLASLLYPAPKAQNEDDEEDKDMAEVMRLLIEYNLRKDNYTYRSVFFMVSALANPALIAHVEYIEAMQTLRTKLQNGDIHISEAIDEVISGVNTHIVPCEELLIANIREHEIQRQRFLIRRRLIDFSSAKARYGAHPNFEYIRPGIRIFFAEDPAGFYERNDDQNPTLVEECIYYNRTEDLEVPFLNGIYMGEQNVKANLVTHRRLVRQKGKMLSMPVYPYCKSGFEPLNENFFYYKSAAFKLTGDQALTDKIWRMVVDGTFLSIIKPAINSGRGKINESVVFPGKVTNLPEGSKVDFLDVGSNLKAGYDLIGSMESTASESTQDKTSQGVSTPGSATAFEIGQLEQNARIQLGLFGRMFSRFVEDLGLLLIDCIIAHQTVGDIAELTSKDQKVKYRTFLVPNQKDGGKSVSKKVQLTEEYMGRDMTDEQLLDESFKLMDQEGGYESSMRIYKVNPYKFSETQFSIVIEADAFPAKSDQFEKAMKLEGYDRMIANPLILNDPEALNAVTRDFLIEPYTKSDPEQYLPKNPQPMMAPAGAQSTSPLVSQMTGSGNLASVLGKPSGSTKVQRSITSQ